jgi:zinc-finger of transposase IS204/IS1001/IS1096/IS1165
MQADWTKVLGWPGYRVYDYQINEARRHLTLRVRRKRGNRKLTCAQCGRRVHQIRAVYERTVRDLPCFEFQTTVVVELYRIRCPDCGIKSERSEQLPSKAPYSKRFEDSVGEACEANATYILQDRVLRAAGLSWVTPCDRGTLEVSAKPPWNRKGAFFGVWEAWLGLRSTSCHQGASPPHVLPWLWRSKGGRY